MTLACDSWSHDGHKERRLFKMKSIIFAEFAGKVRRDKEGEYWAIEGIVGHFCPETHPLESIGKLLVHTNVIPRYCHYSPGMAFSWQDKEEAPETAVCLAIKTKDVPKLVANLPGIAAAEFLSRIEDCHLQDMQKAKHPEGKHSAWEAIRQRPIQLWGRIKTISRIMAGARHSIG